MSLRNYNKLYLNTDREEGSDKIVLGYKNETRESILYADKESYFHIPFYTKTILLNDSSLVDNGATAGPFPAAADRIFKSLKGYGNLTPNGTPSELADGGWFCSWLYKNPDGTRIWMDRFYNPGQFSTSIAAQQLEQGPPYIDHNPVFYDVPSTMKFESGVLYKYFHIGEKTAADLITTYSGISGEKLLLNLTDWNSVSPDTSVNKIPIKIFTNANEVELYNKQTESLEHIYQSTINFNNNKDIDLQVDYDPVYTPTNEFSLAFWAQSNDWKACPSTQLIGNFTTKGGYGLFLDTLSSYPFFVIPETGYGHLLYINEKFNQYLDTSVQINTQLTATPEFIALDSENNVVVCFSDNSRCITKYDNYGQVLNKATIPDIGGKILQFLCGPDDQYVVITEKKRYFYDADLQLSSQVSWGSLGSVTAYAYNSTTNVVELVSYVNALDSKFIETTNFLISSDGNLYKKTADDQAHYMIGKLKDGASTFAIDPYQRLWVMHGKNNISVFDSSATELTGPLFQFTAGEKITYTNKNISFICTYDRTTDIREWKCIIYCSSSDQFISPQLLIYDMDGLIIKTLDILSLLNLNLFRVLKQQQKNLNFASKGDFTGYERKRIFNTIFPYNNTPQLIFKCSLKDRNAETLTFKTFKQFVSLKNWDNRSWQHLVLTLENRKFSLYVNSLLKQTLDYSGQYELSYETQPTLFIGSPVGSKYGFNKEIACTSALFNGLFESIKIFNYPLKQDTLEMFLRASSKAQNLYWNLPTPSIQYMERVERMFKNKIPGSKATFFNLKLQGTKITDLRTRAIIEEELRSIVASIKPIYVEFLKITWVD